MSFVLAGLLMAFAVSGYFFWKRDRRSKLENGVLLAAWELGLLSLIVNLVMLDIAWFPALFAVLVVLLLAYMAVDLYWPKKTRTIEILRVGFASLFIAVCIVAIALMFVALFQFLMATFFELMAFFG